MHCLLAFVVEKMHSIKIGTGVTMFCMAAVHGGFSIIQFHSLGNLNPILSVFLSNTPYTSLTRFPFQTLGFAALIIFFLMAITSHDFWLHNLSPKEFYYPWIVWTLDWAAQTALASRIEIIFITPQCLIADRLK